MRVDPTLPRCGTDRLFESSLVSEADVLTQYCLEVATARFVAAIAIEFDHAAGTLTRCAAVLATFLCRATTTRIFARVCSIIVCH